MYKNHDTKWSQILDIPDIVTWLSLLCAIISIYYASLHNFDIAFGLLMASALCDLGDGILARLLNRSRPFGAYFDCMVDTLAFLAVIPILSYLMGLKNLLFHLLFVTCGVLRHARLLAFPQVKLLGISSTACGFVFPILYFIARAAAFEPLLLFKIFFLITSFLMVSQINFGYRPLFSKRT